jgi:hypothetical protein
MLMNAEHSPKNMNTSLRTPRDERPEQFSVGQHLCLKFSSRRRVPGRLPLATAPRNTASTRDYFRRLRAAEMAAWELTGGDYLLPRFAPRAARFC